MKQWYLSPYYILNYISILVYILFRVYVDRNSNNKNFYRDNTTEKEPHILISFGTLIALRYVRYYTTFSMFLYDMLFYCKLAILSIFTFINYKYAVWYLVFLTITWILFNIPKYEGPTKIIPIISEESYISFIEEHEKKNKSSYSFLVYYSNLSTKCIFVS